VIIVKRQLSNFSAISWREQVNFQGDDDEVRFVLDQIMSQKYRRQNQLNSYVQLKLGDITDKIWQNKILIIIK